MTSQIFISYISIPLINIHKYISNYRAIQEKILEYIQKDDKDDKKENIFTDPSKLFEFVIKESNDSESKLDSKSESNKDANSTPERQSKLITLLITEIQEIINIMTEILYTPPYTILFGRLSVEKPKKQKKIR